MSTIEETPPRLSGANIVAIGLGLLAFLIALIALGRALASPIGESVAVAADPAAAEAAAPSEVEVSLSEFAIAPAAIEISSGTLTVTNEGQAPHNLAIEGTELSTHDLDPGDTGTLTVSDLAPGTYTYLCTIPGHAAAGMTGSLTIADDGTVVADTAAQAGDPSHDMGSMSGSADPVAMQAAMLDAMKGSLAAFPAETEGEGAAVLEPTVLDDGTKLFELTVDEVSWEVEPGKFVDALAYNGAVPGPTMYVDTGDKVTIRIINHLDHEGTSFHPHGLKNHDFSIDGVTFISQDPIETGDSMDYTFVAEEESVVGYHSHHMSLHQVPNGLFGMMVVGDYAQLAGIDGVVDEIPMIVNDSGNIGFSLNGKSFPATKPYVYNSGDKVIVHYANEGQMAHPMHMHNQTGTVIAKDGYLLPEGARYQGDTFNISPGERLTVVYEMGKPGTWVWHCHILSHVKKADGTMFGMLTAVIVNE